MSRLAGSRIGVLCLGSVLLLAVQVASQQAVSSMLQQNVPDAVVTAAAQPGSPERFVHALALLRVPAGVILRKENPSANSFEANGPVGTRVLGDAIEEFRRSHPGYLVEDSETGLFIAPKSSGCVSPLDRIITVEQAGPLNIVLWQIARVVDPATPDFPPNMVGAGGGPDRRGGRDLFRQPVKLRARNVSLRETLMELSKQVPGVVWGVRETPGEEGAPSDCTLTLLTTDHTLFTSYKLQ